MQGKAWFEGRTPPLQHTFDGKQTVVLLAIDISKSEDVIEENVQRWGIDALLMKPFRIDQLSRIVRRVLDQNRL